MFIFPSGYLESTVNMDGVSLLKDYLGQLTSHEEYVVVLANLAELMLQSALELYAGNTSSASNHYPLLLPVQEIFCSSEFSYTRGPLQ